MGVGLIKSPITATLNSSTYTALTLGDEDAYGFLVTVVEDGLLVPFYYATDAAGTDEAPSPDVGRGWPHYASMGTTVIFLKAVSGTPTAVLDPGHVVER